MDGGILIPCPQCGQDLRLKDRSLLGRTGRCPRCGHRFPLEEPDEVELELVDAPAQSARPVVGTSARWVPDDPPASPSPSSAAPAARAPFDFADPGDGSAAPTRGSAPVRGTKAAKAKHAQRGTAPAGAAASTDDSDSTAARLRELRRRSARRRNLAIAIGAGSAVVVMIAFFAIRSFGLGAPPAPEGKKPPQVDVAWTAAKDQLRANFALAGTRNPTRGEPIRLLYVPAGASIIFNLHPREMWFGAGSGYAPPVIVAGLGEQFDKWSKEAIKSICLFDPQEIEEALICMHLGSKGTPPFVSAVVRLAETPKLSDLVLRFQAEKTEEHGPPMYVGPDRAYMVRDNGRTVSIAPAEYAAEMARAVARPNSTSPSIEALLPLTDRKRLVTIVCQRQDLIVHREELFPEVLRPVADLFVLWLGNDVDALAWSAHQGTREFHSELSILPIAASSPSKLHAELRRKLDRLPVEMLSAVQKMSPETVGSRHLIGRYPAMLQAYALETLGGIGDGIVRFTTVLPDRAAPNLTVATALTWNESLRTDFTREVGPAEPAAPKLPETVAGRLQLPVEIDFERIPLQQAFEFIGGEIQVTFDIDGDALMAAGMTKNMEQNQKLGTVPAIQGVQAIINRYKAEGMCIVIDEATRTAIVTTITAAETKNQKPALTPK